MISSSCDFLALLNLSAAAVSHDAELTTNITSSMMCSLTTLDSSAHSPTHYLSFLPVMLSIYYYIFLNFIRTVGAHRQGKGGMCVWERKSTSIHYVTPQMSIVGPGWSWHHNAGFLLGWQELDYWSPHRRFLGSVLARGWNQVLNMDALMGMWAS